MSYAGVNVDLDTDDVKLTDAQRKAAATTLSGDAAAAARGARQFIENVVDNLLCGGLFGKIEHYWFSTECQNRGSLHWHGLLWIAGTPRSRTAFDAWLQQQRARNTKMTETWLDSVVSESLPPMPPEYDVAEARVHVFLVVCGLAVTLTNVVYDERVFRPSATSQQPLMRSRSCHRFVGCGCVSVLFDIFVFRLNLVARSLVAALVAVER